MPSAPEGQAAAVPAPRKNLRRRALIAGIALVVIAAVATPVGIYLYRLLDMHHFAVVEPGVLYRSGQPDHYLLRRLTRVYGIRTVINLRGPDESAKDPSAVEALDWIHRHGLKSVFIPVGPTNREECVAEFLALVRDRANQPVLVHCAGGRDRTGVLVACYRLAVDGWDVQRVIEEMKTFGYRAEAKVDMTQFVRDYAERVRQERSAPPQSASH